MISISTWTLVILISVVVVVMLIVLFLKSPAGSKSVEAAKGVASMCGNHVVYKV